MFKEVRLRLEEEGLEEGPCIHDCSAVSKLVASTIVCHD